MVGISGIKDRQIQLFKDKYGNDVIVFGGWENWEKYYEKYLDQKLFPNEQWQWKQNYPELVVEDLVEIFGTSLYDWWSEEDIRDIGYAELLKRGVNKWLFVRYMLIRYKKLVADWRNGAWDRYIRWKSLYDMAYPRRFEMSANEWGRINYMKGYWKGYYDAMRKVRADLKTLCCSPRYVVWNGSRPGFVVDKKVSKGWLRLIQELYDVRFEK